MGANFSADISNDTKEIVHTQINKKVSSTKQTTDVKAEAKAIQTVEMGNVSLGPNCTFDATNIADSKSFIANMSIIKDEDQLKDQIKEQITQSIKQKLEQRNKDSWIPSLNVSASLSNVSEDLKTNTENLVKKTVNSMFKATDATEGKQKIILKDLTCIDGGKITFTNEAMTQQVAKNAAKQMSKTIMSNKVQAQVSSTRESTVTQTNETSLGMIVMAIAGVSVLGGVASSSKKKKSNQVGGGGGAIITLVIGLIFGGIAFYLYEKDVEVKEWKCGTHPAILKLGIKKQLTKIDKDDNNEVPNKTLNKDLKPNKKQITTLEKMYDPTTTMLMMPWTDEYKNYKLNAELLNKEENWNCYITGADGKKCNKCWKGENYKPKSKSPSPLHYSFWKMGWIGCIVICVICLIMGGLNMGGDTAESPPVSSYTGATATPVPINTGGKIKSGKIKSGRKHK